MKYQKLPLCIDAIFCLIVMPAMIMLLPIKLWIAHEPMFVYILLLWLYLIYLANRKIIVPRLISNRKQIIIAILLLLATMVGTYFITRYQIDTPFKRMPRPAFMRQMPKIRIQQQGVWFLYFIVTSFGLAIGFLTELFHQKSERTQIEFEKKKAELALYKAQINPHFLFNSLNTLYGMVITKSAKTEEAFVQFIDLMRYMYSNNNEDKIPVQTEVEYIRQYVELQKNRIAEGSKVHFSYTHDGTDEMKIAPMILITFVENLFKHGISSYEIVDAYITIKAHDGVLTFSTMNPILNVRAEGASNGIGISNCKKRLALLYPNGHKLTIEEKDDNYMVTLTINLRE